MLYISICTRKEERGDLPIDRLDLEIDVEVERELDTEGLAALVKGGDDGLETSLDLDFGRSVGGLLDGVLVVSKGTGLKVDVGLRKVIKEGTKGKKGRKKDLRWRSATR